MMNKILLVEDSPEFQRMIQSALGFKYKIDAVDTLENARKQFHASSYDLVLLDVLLPDGIGYDFCKEVQIGSKDSHPTPVIILTGKNSTSDKIVGFTVGADDYVTKPFDSMELLARVDSKILKAQKKKETTDSFHKGPFMVEVTSMRAYLQPDGTTANKLDLTPIEFKIFIKLLQNNNRVFSRQQLIDNVWGAGVFVEDRSIDKHISSLRKKIEPYHKLIRTVSGVGYELQM